MPSEPQYSDVLLIGSGIMSATLGALIKIAYPEKSIRLLEASKSFAQESSNAWNNAGTGHAGLCELSYTPTMSSDGTVNVTKAIDIFTQFEKSRQFWSSAVRDGILRDPRRFINPVPHISFVWGADQVQFLKARYDALRKHHFFHSMEFTDDRALISEWAPLLIKGRKEDVPVAATRMMNGTDINFGEIARQLVRWLDSHSDAEALTGHRVTSLARADDSELWCATTRDLRTSETKRFTAPFVFVGAGGGTLPLLQSADVAEVRGYGGFPVGGQWLVCYKPDVVAQHDAKVYGNALGAAPTMAVPHLDTRVIDGRKALLFGPYASWTTKFLKQTGHAADLFKSLTLRNVAPIVGTGLREVPLVRYLVGQGLQSFDTRIAALRAFYPEADTRDWRLREAGIRVQAITGVGGIVHFGTEVVVNEDRSLAGLLGASPGASVSVDAMIDVFTRCFGPAADVPALLKMIPSLTADVSAPTYAPLYDAAKAAVDKWLLL